ncbi:MAG: hypothetical protein IKQ77_16300 [Prevotella sp.]|nr:hypothetical protein [Prevotella sp.]
MTVWKNNKEKHTPFAARGNGRMREVEEKLKFLEEQLDNQLKLLVVEEPPETCEPNTIYLVCKDMDD